MRRPARFAAVFYPRTHQVCRQEAESLLASPPEDDLPGAPVAGIVPHAGWVYSGVIAARVIRWLVRSRPRTVILVGNDHRGACMAPTLWAGGAWDTPLGAARVDDDLVSRLRADATFQVSTHGFEDEHSVEVQLPLLQAALGDGLRIVPMQVPPCDGAEHAGAAIAEALSDRDDVVILGTTDLTHYGPNYGFEPHGGGPDAVRWVKEENDPAMIAKLISLEAAGIHHEYRTARNACSPGALVTTLTAARALGCSEGHVLDYRTSWDVRPDDSFVGYVGVAYPRPLA
ncbi:MAG: AmmeMemoRadiSam system protein B [Planctomycetes bacterium]|nr:AmmeMemoRadiSam system protein B [Planctomycetota bacterium]